VVLSKFTIGDKIMEPEKNTFLDIKFNNNWHVGIYVGDDKFKILKSFDYDGTKPDTYILANEVQEWCNFNRR
jgi:hypothetical protein